MSVKTVAILLFTFALPDCCRPANAPGSPAGARMHHNNLHEQTSPKEQTQPGPYFRQSGAAGCWPARLNAQPYLCRLAKAGINLHTDTNDAHLSIYTKRGAPPRPFIHHTTVVLRYLSPVLILRAITSNRCQCLGPRNALPSSSTS
jgi:hypothetical protein